MTGKPYEAGDLSIELDKRVKSKVAEFCGNDEYQFGDLSKEIDRRVKNRVADYIGKDEYEFGDISRQIEKNRRAWVKDFLGEEAAGNYEFGDITKKAMANLTGQDDYQVRPRIGLCKKAGHAFQHFAQQFDLSNIWHFCFSLATLQRS